MKTSYLVIALGIIILLAAGLYAIQSTTEVEAPTDPVNTMPVEPDGGIGDGAAPLEVPDGDIGQVDSYQSETVLGQSVAGREIVAQHFGNGSNEVVLAAGLHGSYSPNTARLGNELIEYFAQNAAAVPEGMRVTVIPNINPDGMANSDTVAGRFNNNNVDLNRNFACDWAPTSMWQNREVSGGTAAFSEPEAVAVRDYLNEINPVGAIVYYAAEGAVYASACGGSPSAESLAIATTYANASDYSVDAEFDAYEINGDMTNWLADQGVPAISVLLTDRTTTEFARNLRGVQAVIDSLTSSN
jgi:predicted deacylase